jgi:hypothetical protein
MIWKQHFPVKKTISHELARVDKETTLHAEQQGNDNGGMIKFECYKG